MGCSTVFTLFILPYTLFIEENLLNYLYFCTLFNKTVVTIRRSASTYNGTFQFFNQRHCY